MCGRYASARKRQELLDEFRIERDRVDESLEPDYNVAPTKRVYAVTTRGSRGSGDAGPQDVARELRVVRWGLVPYWAKDPKIGSRMINARAETVDSKPAFRQAFTRRRCLLPADGFYEWQQVADGGKARKQPYFIHPADDGVLAFAGLYEIWRDKSYPEDHPDAFLWTATIITTQAEDSVGKIKEENITSRFRIQSIEPVGRQPWTYVAFGVKEVHRIQQGTERTDRIVARYTVRLIQEGRSERNASGLLLAEYKEEQMVGEKDLGLQQRSTLLEQR